MNEFYLGIAILLSMCLLGGLIRVILGRGKTNRLLAAQLMGTISVTGVLLLSVAMAEENLVDVAVILSLLASITVIAFVKLADRKSAR